MVLASATLPVSAKVTTPDGFVVELEIPAGASVVLEQTNLAALPEYETFDPAPLSPSEVEGMIARNKAFEALKAEARDLEADARADGIRRNLEGHAPGSFNDQMAALWAEADCLREQALDQVLAQILGDFLADDDCFPFETAVPFRPDPSKRGKIFSASHWGGAPVSRFAADGRPFQ